MKKITAVFVITIMGIICLSMTIQTRKRVIFFGDSITQMGVNPGGFISRVQKEIDDKGLKNQFELIGSGEGANKIYDLFFRLEGDVLDKKPDMVFIYIGVNDVWHKTSGIGTDIEKFEKFYAAIIKKIEAKNCKVVLCIPALIGEKKNNGNPQDADLNAYGDVIEKLSKTYHCGLINLRKIFVDYDAVYNTNDAESGLLTIDRVHLTDKGNELVAKEILKFLL